MRWRQPGLSRATSHGRTEEVLRKLRRHYPRYYPRSRIWTEVSGLASAARQQFGSRTNALIAAGLCDKSDRPRRRWTRQRVLEELRCQVGRGVPVTKIWQQDIGLHSAAIRLFGAWNEAVRAGGASTEGDAILE